MNSNCSNVSSTCYTLFYTECVIQWIHSFHLTQLFESMITNFNIMNTNLDFFILTGLLISINPHLYFLWISENKYSFILKKNLIHTLILISIVRIFLKYFRLPFYNLIASSHPQFLLEGRNPNVMWGLFQTYLKTGSHGIGNFHTEKQPFK